MTSVNSPPATLLANAATTKASAARPITTSVMM